MTFENWMYLVENRLHIQFGCYSESLAEHNWKLDFERKLTPAEAVYYFVDEYYQD